MANVTTAAKYPPSIAAKARTVDASDFCVVLDPGELLGFEAPLVDATEPGVPVLVAVLLPLPAPAVLALPLLKPQVPPLRRLS